MARPQLDDDRPLGRGLRYKQEPVWSYSSAFAKDEPRKATCLHVPLAAAPAHLFVLGPSIQCLGLLESQCMMVAWLLLKTDSSC